jgi:beta-lactamase superfamily II metal-dependent hydrolase
MTMKAARKAKTPRKAATPKRDGSASAGPASTTVPQPAVSQPERQRVPPAAGATGVRVRMYRVGFGDFFLLSIPGRGGNMSHILIDCGVHHSDLGSIQEAVAQMALDCGHKLALVIMTHRHADHISGFGTCSEVFSNIEVDRVWMPWFEDPQNREAKQFQSNLSALASHLGSGLQARLAAAGPDPAVQQLKSMAENITGAAGANAKALQTLQSGFKTKAVHRYYKAGDTADLPQELIDAGLTAEILGPPIDKALVVQMTNKTQQYLSAAIAADQDDDRSPLFPQPFIVGVDKISKLAFEMYDPDQIKRMVNSSQPDMLAAQAVAADKTLNNQSLVILFGFAGKHLLFAGDAQWGNWENFLYGGAYGTPGHTTMTDAAKTILDKIDFYKVGHHGSANASPTDFVKAMRLGCVCMCSTQEPAYSEVPRVPLLAALRERANNQVARSDMIAVGKNLPNPAAGQLPSAFSAPTRTLFIDYNL